MTLAPVGMLILALVTGPSDSTHHGTVSDSTLTWEALLDSANRLADKHLYDESLAVCETGLAVARARYGELHKSSALFFHRMALIHRSRTGSAPAESLYLRALDTWKRLPEPEPVLMARTLSGLGTYYVMTGDYDRGEAMLKEGIKDLEHAPTSSSSGEISLASGLNNLGNLYRISGRYELAIETMSRSIALYKKHYAPDHPLIAALTANLAVPYAQTGNIAMAEHMYREGLAIHVLHHDSTETGRILNSLALLSQQTGRAREADSLFSASVEYARNTKYNAGIVAEVLANHARFAFLTGNNGAAESLARESLDAAHGTSADNAVDRTNSLQTLGRVYRTRGEFSRADSLLTLVLNQRRELLGGTHTRVEEACEDLALLRLFQKRQEEALLLAEEALGISRNNFAQVTAFTSETAALGYASHAREALGTFLACFGALPNPSRQQEIRAIEAILNGKGLVTDYAFGHRESSSPDSTSRALVSACRVLRLALSGRYAQGKGSATAEEHMHTLDSLQLRLFTLEDSLTRLHPRVLPQDHETEIHLATLAAALPRGSALVEYLRVRAPDGGSTTDHRYVAAVVSREGAGHFVPLGAAREIDSQIDAYRRHMAMMARSAAPPTLDDEKAYAVIAGRLFSTLWSPVEPFVHHDSVVLVSPDGPLNLVAFGGLVFPDGRYVIERYALHYLSAGRDLLLYPETNAHHGNGLLALGDPVFGPGSHNGMTTMRTVPAPCGTPATMSVEPLPGSRKEVTAIAAFWNGRLEPVSVFVGAAASEEQFRKSAPGKRILHLATHAYFLSGPCGDDQGASEPMGGNPLLFSGLLLSGSTSNGQTEPTKGAEADGVITALEIADMDLRGTDLVVLSSCGSGLGRVEEGEGVYGLRRAFQMAGARTVIGSLWEVPDRETTRFMTALYADPSEGYPELLRRAALDRLREARMRKRPTHPFSWGAFTTTGDWRVR